MSFATLGPITFEASDQRIRTWQEAKRSGPARYHSHDVHGFKPVKEFLGPGNDTLTFSMLLDATRGVVPRDELRALRKSRDTGEVLDFVVGGELVGDFVIENLAEVWKLIDARGVLQKATVDVTLGEYR